MMLSKKIEERLSNLEVKFHGGFMEEYLELMKSHSKYLVDLYSRRCFDTPNGAMFASINELKAMRDFCDKAIKEIEEI